MKALVKYQSGVGNVEIRDVAEPACGDNQVKIEVAFCGICGTDLHVYHDTFRSYPPVIMGHEFGGRVVETGRGVRSVSAGDRVAVLPASAVTCGSCVYCRSGQFMFCPERRGMGHGVNGAFARYAVVRQDQVYKIPAHLTLEEAALCEPFAAAVQPVLELNELHLSDVALVSGPGPIGLGCAKLLLAAGVKTLVAGTSQDQLRLEAASRLGADLIVNVDQDDLQQMVRQQTGGRGVNLAFECAGAAPSARACLEALRPLGSYTQVGIFGRDVTLPMDLAIYKQLQVKGSVGYTVKTWERLMCLLEYDRIRLLDLISHTLPLDHWQEAFQLCTDKTALKVLLSPVSEGD